MTAIRRCSSLLSAKDSEVAAAVLRCFVNTYWS